MNVSYYTTLMPRLHTASWGTVAYRVYYFTVQIKTLPSINRYTLNYCQLKQLKRVQRKKQIKCLQIYTLHILLRRPIKTINQLI